MSTGSKYRNFEQLHISVSIKVYFRLIMRASSNPALSVIIALWLFLIAISWWKSLDTPYSYQADVYADNLSYVCITAASAYRLMSFFLQSGHFIFLLLRIELRLTWMYEEPTEKARTHNVSLQLVACPNYQLIMKDQTPSDSPHTVQLFQNVISDCFVREYSSPIWTNRAYTSQFFLSFTECTIPIQLYVSTRQHAKPSRNHKKCSY